MSVVFSGDELINLAIGIERRGITFYDIMAKSTDDEMARMAFEALVNMERQHIAIFEDMLSEGALTSDISGKGPEHADYLRSLVDDRRSSAPRVPAPCRDPAPTSAPAVPPLPSPCPRSSTRPR